MTKPILFLFIAYRLNGQEQTGPAVSSSRLAEAMAYYSNCHAEFQQHHFSKARAICALSKSTADRMSESEKAGAKNFLEKLRATTNDIQQLDSLIESQSRETMKMLAASRLDSAQNAFHPIQSFAGDERVIRAKELLTEKVDKFKWFLATADEAKIHGVGATEEILRNYQIAKYLNKDRELEINGKMAAVEVWRRRGPAGRYR